MPLSYKRRLLRQYPSTKYYRLSLNHFSAPFTTDPAKFANFFNGSSRSSDDDSSVFAALESEPTGVSVTFAAKQKKDGKILCQRIVLTVNEILYQHPSTMNFALT